MRMLTLNLFFLFLVMHFSLSVHAQLGWTQSGEISFYSDRFHGRKMASGIAYDKDKETCAHRELAFGTTIRIQDLNSSKTATCIIMDRGPWRSNSILDVSKKVSSQLAMGEDKYYKIIVIGLPPDVEDQTSVDPLLEQKKQKEEELRELQKAVESELNKCLNEISSLSSE